MLKKLEINSELIYSMVLLLPYVEGPLFKRLFTIYFGDKAYIPAILLLILALNIVICLSLIITNKKYKTQGFQLIDMLLLVTCFIGGIISINHEKFISLWMSFSMPVVFGTLYMKLFGSENINKERIIKYMVNWFIAYLSLVVVYYIFHYHLFLNPSIRIDSRGGGSVIFGYTIAIVFAFTMYFRRCFNNFNYYLVLIVLTLGAFGTGSRGAVWPIILMWGVNFLFSPYKNERVAIMITAPFILIGVLVLMNVSIDDATSRLLKFSDYSRSVTLKSALNIFNNQDLAIKLFGRGLGQFFPYQEWVIESNNNPDLVLQNFFYYEGQPLLVQPHNSFIYILLECGFVGIAMLVLYLLNVFYGAIRVKNNRIFAMLFVIVFVAVNCLDSIFIVQPGAACSFWVLLFILEYDVNSKNRGRINEFKKVN